MPNGSGRACSSWRAPGREVNGSAGGSAIPTAYPRTLRVPNPRPQSRANLSRLKLAQNSDSGRGGRVEWAARRRRACSRIG